MSERSKKIFLGICIIVPFFLYCFYYYSSMISNAPYRWVDFESIVLKYGDEGTLKNEFDSSTGIFTYLNQQDSLVSDTLRFRDDDLLYLHRKAAELGFWNLPEDMTGTSFDSAQSQVPRFVLQYNYKDKSKTVTYDADFEGNQKMKDAARSVIDEVRRVISDVSGR
jgi:hypothetical protein